ncbi:MAG TPA: HAD hydrolase family protein [Polyangiaceae bacterium]|jgi:3-deoxy-D-manno-octulosonate 8-phosphate phosphatase (KDO 8-P phosphatase)|nr:HAD hydrolase family protein [Polyangiaceae bacterium]
MKEHFAKVELFAFDIDGTLTDGTTTWLGDDVGWVQTYSVRDGEALLRIQARGIPVMPLSRNKTRCARVRMERLALPTDWLGISDKIGALDDLAKRNDVPYDRILYVGDGLEDAPVLRAVGCGCAVADAHPRTREAAHFVATSRGGGRVIEEIADILFAAKGWDS